MRSKHGATWSICVLLGSCRPAQAYTSRQENNVVALGYYLNVVDLLLEYSTTSSIHTSLFYYFCLVLTVLNQLATDRCTPVTVALSTLTHLGLLLGYGNSENKTHTVQLLHIRHLKQLFTINASSVVGLGLLVVSLHLQHFPSMPQTHLSIHFTFIVRISHLVRGGTRAVGNQLEVF